MTLNALGALELGDNAAHEARDAGLALALVALRRDNGREGREAFLEIGVDDLPTSELDWRAPRIG